MITRTTTVGTLKNYRYDLNRSNNTLAKSMNKVTTRRNFNSYMEDPALATRCFQMRRSFLRTSTQLTINESLRHKYDVAWAAMDGISQDIDTIAKDTAFGSILTGLNGPDASGRNALGQSMAAKARSIVQTMNSRFGENYVFAGADTLNAPFTWEPRLNPGYIEGTPDPTNEEHAAAFKYEINPDLVEPTGTEFPEGTLYTNDPGKALIVSKENVYYNEKYTKEVDDAIAAGELTPEEAAEKKQDGRYGQYASSVLGEIGTNNEADALKVPAENEKYYPDWNCKYLTDKDTGTNDKAQAASDLYYRGVAVDSTAPKDLEKMQYYTKGETKYMDVGIGHKEDANGNAISSTVFDSALQGTYYLGGYGTSEITCSVGSAEDGYEITREVPNNIVTIMNRMSELLLRCNSDDGDWASTEDKEEFYALAHKFEDTASLVKQRWDEMDTESGFLRDNSDFLTDTADSISQQFMELEDVNPAAAITEYMFARYCFDAALKVGNSVLSQSLMDYMSF